MKIRKYLFRDHYKVSTDKFRDILGLYHDYKNQNLTDLSNPIKEIFNHSIFSISDAVIVDEDQGLYKQNVTFKPTNLDSNQRFLNQEYRQRSIEELDQNLIPRRVDFQQGGNGFIYTTPAPIEGPGELNTTTQTSNNTSPIEVTVPLDPVIPISGKTNREVIVDTIRSNKHYEDINTIVDEVTDLKIGTDDSYVNIESKYNFFIPKYEEQIQSNLIPEEILPNFYVVSLALNQDILNSISQDDYNSSLALGNTSPYENLNKKFDKFITLDGNLSLDRNGDIGFFFALALVAYMEQYAEVYDSVSVDYIETVKKRFGHLFNNLTNKEILDKLNEFKSSYPLYINIEWTTTTLSPLLVFLQNAGISLQALQSFLGDKLLIKIQSSGLSEVSRFSILAQSPRLDFTTGLGHFEEYSQNLYTYDAGQWIIDFLLEIFAGTSNEIIHPNELLVIDQNGQEIPITDQFDPTRGAIDIYEILNAISAIPGYRDLLNTSIRTYKQLIEGDFAKSEVLLYKIEKRNSQHVLLQTFYIPNVSGINVQNYVDTQVKYNKEYKYKIFAYTAIYGTEYYYSRFQSETDDTHYYRAGEGHLSIDTNISLGMSNKKVKQPIKENSIVGYFRVLSADEGHQLFDIFMNTSIAGSDQFTLGFFGDTTSLNVDNLLINKWYHFSIVSKKVKSIEGISFIRELYIDARLAGSVIADPIVEFKNRILIPGYAPSATDPLFDPFGSFGNYSTVTRDMSNIAVFDRALEYSEIKSLKNLGRCWDIRKSKKGIPPLNINDWTGEVPSFYWRKKAIYNVVTNDGFAGEANLVLHGDAVSIKCDDNSIPDDSKKETFEPRNIEPRDIIPPLFEEYPVYGETDSLTPVDPFIIEPQEPFKGSTGVPEFLDIGIPYEPPGVPGYGEVFIPPEEPPFIPQESPPDFIKQEVYIPTPTVPTVPITVPGKKYIPVISVGGDTTPPVQPAQPSTTSGYAEVFIAPDASTPTVRVVPTVIPNMPSVPDTRVTTAQITPQTARPISAGGGTSPPLVPPKKTVFTRDTQVTPVKKEQAPILQPSPVTIKKDIITQKASTLITTKGTKK